MIIFIVVVGLFFSLLYQLIYFSARCDKPENEEEDEEVWRGTEFGIEPATDEKTDQRTNCEEDRDGAEEAELSEIISLFSLSRSINIRQILPSFKIKARK